MTRSLNFRSLQYCKIAKRFDRQLFVYDRQTINNIQCLTSLYDQKDDRDYSMTDHYAPKTSVDRFDLNDG